MAVIRGRRLDWVAGPELIDSEEDIIEQLDYTFPHMGLSYCKIIGCISQIPMLTSRLLYVL